MLLRPGVDVEQTFALNQAGISQSQLMRTMNGITQTMGGWLQFGLVNIPSTVRCLHAWQGLAGEHATSPSSNGIDKFLAAGATQTLGILTATSYQDITPQTRISDVVPNISISSGSNIVTVTDANSGVSILDSVQFRTPVSIGNILLQGAYPINSVVSTGAYTILSAVVASTTIASSGILPTFTTATNSVLVTVSEPNNTAQAIVGLQQSFLVPTTVGGITIEGAYNVFSISNSTDYVISVPAAATGVATATMNNGNAEYLYYINNGAIMGTLGYGGGAYGSGGYGTGATPSGEAGIPITATDWTLENWGEILLAVPEDGPLYAWSPTAGFLNAALVPQAPLINMGCFISMPQQILVLWGSAQSTGTHDHLIVRWSDAGDFTNWTVAPDTTAGSFHLPSGSMIRGGLQAPNYGVIWTDIDLWIMQFTNDPVSVFNFTRAASGCGLIGRHAAGVLAGNVYWCSEANFYVLSGSGVDIVPCTVWDFIFQNINREEQSKVCFAANSEFNEVAWYFPFGTATENDAYVKFNLKDKTWDYGFLERTAWSDVSVIGAPVGTDHGGYVWQHERGNHINGAGNSYFKTGWWTISDGEDLAFVDLVMPDFIWGQDGDESGSVSMTFFSADYPGDTPRSYGPYIVTKANQYITPRIRGRLLAFEAQSATNDVFWRLGRIRYRWAPAGRR